MNTKKFLFIIFFFIILLLLVAADHAYSLLNKTESTSETPLANEQKKGIEEKPVVNKTEAVVISVGDIFIHQSILDSVFEPTKKTYNFEDSFSLIGDYLKEADLSTAWLGGVMDTKDPYRGYPLFKSPAELVETLKNISLDVVFRTNHTLDYGEKGLQTTTEILEKNNINQIAAYPTEESSKNIFIYQKDNLKISFLGYVYGMNGISIPKTWMINLIDLEKIKNDIKEAKEKSDFVIVALHFGNEYERYPSKWQKDIAKKIADFGTDMIIGSHPHVLQPAEIITSFDGRKVFVAYGLGNFFCGQRQHYTDSGVILKYIIEKNEGKTRLKEVNYIPTWVAKYKEKDKYQFKIQPSKKYIKIYQDGEANFLSLENYKHLQETYRETIDHLNNPEIGFTEID